MKCKHSLIFVTWAKADLSTPQESVTALVPAAAH
jgi:hypothetical protein